MDSVGGLWMHGHGASIWHIMLAAITNTEPVGHFTVEDELKICAQISGQCLEN